MIVIDLFGLYWYFELKKLAIAILMIIIVFLAIFMLLEREKDPDSFSKPSNGGGGTSLRDMIPSSEEFNERAEAALGGERPSSSSKPSNSLFERYNLSPLRS